MPLLPKEFSVFLSASVQPPAAFDALLHQRPADSFASVSFVDRQVLNLLGELRERLDLTMMLISHDVRVVAGACSRVGVMLAGRIVEEGPVAEVLGRPKHPYTRSLVGVASGTVIVGGPTNWLSRVHAITVLGAAERLPVTST